MALINGTSAAETLTGGAENDVITGGGGRDQISGGDGKDTLSGGGGGGATIKGEAGDDVIYGDDGIGYVRSGDNIQGGEGNDHLYVGRSDTASGGTGSDVFHFPRYFPYSGGMAIITDFDVASDRIDLTNISGERGIASFSVAKDLISATTYQGKAGTAVTVNYDGGTSIILFLEGVTASQLTVANFLVTGATSNPSGIFSTGLRDLYGTLGNDSVNGSVNDERLYGDAGNDTLFGGTGTDTLIGGAGNDVFVHSGDGAVTIQDFEQGSDRIDLREFGVRDFTMLREIMTAAPAGGTVIATRGIFGSDRLLVGTEISKLTAADFIFAPADYGMRLVADQYTSDILAGNGNDTITGGSGSNFILAGAGDDRIIVSSGFDTLVGGSGKDVLVFSDAGYSYGYRGTYFRDFTQGEDRIDLRATGIASLETVKQLGFATIIEGNNQVTEFVIDLPGGGEADLILAIDPTRLTAADFIFEDSGTARTVTATSYGGALYGGLGDDVLRGLGESWLYGDAGNDTLTGDGGDQLVGGSGRDVFRTEMRSGLNNPVKVIDFKQGEDRIDLSPWGIRDFATFSMILADDRLYGRLNFLAQVMDVGIPSARLTAQDFVYAADDGRGQWLTATNSNSSNMFNPVPVVGGSGDDMIRGSRYADWLVGGAGNDTLVATGGEDVLAGGAGSDIFVIVPATNSSTFASIIDFTRGIDKVDLSATSINSFQALLASSNAILQASGNVVRIEFGGGAVDIRTDRSKLTAADFIFASNPTGSLHLTSALSGEMNLFGGAGNDTLEGSQASQLLFGGDGDDSFIPGSTTTAYGNDTIIGGAGLDRVIFNDTSSFWQIATVNNITTASSVRGEKTLITGVEKLVFNDRTIDLSGGTVPTLKLSGGAVREGQSGTAANLAFTATLSAAGTSDVSFSFTVRASTTVDAVIKTVTIPAGSTSVTVLVPVKGDVLVEADQSVLATVTDLSGALFASSNGRYLYATGTVVNDDFQAGFSVEAYRALNGGLGSDAAAMQDYIANGRAAGKVASGFDAEAYAAFNPELYRSFGLNASALLNHFVSTGRTEGRVAEGFDAMAYAALNPDLFGAFGTNRQALVEHFITSGRAEGRATAGFDAEAYAALNPDLFRVFGLNEWALISHYIQFGRAEGRSAIGFSAEAYAAFNSDLYNAFGLDHAALVRHYVDYGRGEGRLAYNGTAQGLVPTAPLDLLGYVPRSDFAYMDA
ncbi:hypothetical protein IP70_19455 [alpha proteobacterium AAP38]|nr:hypothetical protein IP70_19455 [alpha proteobacterium AAP38]